VSSPSFHYESRLRRSGYRIVAGVDEVGRGPLAGPVVAAAVILPHGRKIKGLQDSKKLKPLSREIVCRCVRETALGIGVGIISEKVIDEINIHNATLLAMRRAVERLSIIPDHVIVDGRQAIAGIEIPQTPLRCGDARSASVAAASVIAKVVRDSIMMDFDSIYPGFGLRRHKGYGTEEHFNVIRKKGLLPIHRKSFYPASSLA